MTMIYYTSAFEKEYRKLVRKNPQLREKTKRKIEFFLKNSQHPSLRIHKAYSSKVGEVFSFSIEEDLRILFRWKGKDKMIFYRIGSHKEIY